MIKRTLEISEARVFLSIEHDQLVLSRDRQEIARVPCEDVGVLIVDQVATTYTHAVFTRLLAHGAVILICGADHVPGGMLLSMENNQLTGRRIRRQAQAKLPLRKRLWKQIVQHKIRLQASNLPRSSIARRKLDAMIPEVRSGDPSNVEGRAAAIYFRAMFGDSFRRLQEGPFPNNLLNYGYMTMRAAVARALVAAGLHPALSLQHSHRNNAFALADDLVEVLRPLVDAETRSLRESGCLEIERTSKTALLRLLSREVSVGEHSGPLLVQLHRVATSLCRCFEGLEDQLALPEYSLQTSETNPVMREQPPAARDSGDRK